MKLSEPIRASSKNELPRKPITRSSLALSRSSIGVWCIRLHQWWNLSSTLAIGLHGKPHLFGFVGCPSDFLRVGVEHQHAKSLRSLHGPKSPTLVRTRRSRRTGYGATRTAIRTEATVALSGRCELRRRDRIAGCVAASRWPPFERIGGERHHPV